MERMKKKVEKRATVIEITKQKQNQSIMEGKDDNYGRQGTLCTVRGQKQEMSSTWRG